MMKQIPKVLKHKRFYSNKSFKITTVGNKTITIKSENNNVIQDLNGLLKSKIKKVQKIPDNINLDSFKFGVSGAFIRPDICEIELNDSNEKFVIDTNQISDVSNIGIYDEDGYYEGEMKNEKKHGRGKYIWNNKNTYDGEWENDVPHGHGIYSYYCKDGSHNGVYCGKFMNDMRHGRGTYTWENAKYVGEWMNDEKHGQGILTWANHLPKEGIWSNGNFTRSNSITNNYHKDNNYSSSLPKSNVEDDYNKDNNYSSSSPKSNDNSISDKANLVISVVIVLSLILLSLDFFTKI